MRTSLCLLLGLILCSPGGHAQTCGAPAVLQDGWSIATPQSVGLDEIRLCAIGDRLARVQKPNIHAAVVIRHGKLIFEQYFPGTDEIWGNAIGSVRFGPEVKPCARSAKA
jgi:hypothetical protein